MAASTRVTPLSMAALTIAGGAMSLSVYLYTRLRYVERRLIEEREEQRAALLHLTQRVEAAMESRPSLPRMPAVTATVVSQGTSAANESSLPVSRSSSACTSRSHDDPGYKTADDSGYKTADEEADEDESPPPRMSAASAAAAVFGRRPAAAKPPPPDYVDAGESSPSKTEWASQSIMAEGGSWSCIDGVANSAAAAGSSASDLHGGEAVTQDAAAAAAKAADHAVCSKADELYEKKEFEAASELLSGAEQSVEVQWRRCRLCKELGEAAKLAGDPDKCKALLYEGLEHVTLALNLGDKGA